MTQPQPSGGEACAAASRHAMQAGNAAMQAGENHAALRWFERASRLVPNDTVPRHMIVAALARIDPARALETVAGLIEAAPHDRDAHVAHISLLNRCDDARAADELDLFLSRFSLPRGRAFVSLANAIAQRSGCAGWAACTAGGTVVCQGASLSLALDNARPFRNGALAGEHALPPSWRHAAMLRTTSPAGRVLGASIDLAGLRHVDGFVAFDPERGLHGWAVAPADPDRVQVIDIFAGAARRPCMSVAADDDRLVPQGCHAPAAARGFAVPAASLPEASRWHVRTRYGTDLAGSPVLAPRPARAERPTPHRRPIDIIVPLFRGAAQAARCVESLRGSLPDNARIVAIDDASPEAELRDWATREAASGRIVLLRHKRNRGFPSAVNTGLRHAAGRDAVLLNSDTVLPPGAIERLAEAAYAASDIGSVTPMTNDGSLTTLGTPDVACAVNDSGSLVRIDADLRHANAGLRIDIPTCVGFCCFIRHDCLAGTGLLRRHVFAQGYGEENDFSRRAARLGWRHVAACDVFVAHQGGASFGAVRQALMARNLAAVERLHPGYIALVDAFTARDPLAPARSRYDARRWAADRRARATIIVTHGEGGGVERHVASRVAEIRARGERAIVVRPGGGFRVSDGCGATHPGLVFSTVEELAHFLRADHPGRVELHHMATHNPGIERLAGLLRVPFDIFVHDYAAVCPRVTLCAAGTYCGEPDDARDCEDCIADHGARLNIGGHVAARRQSQAALFAAAASVVMATRDCQHRLRRYMPHVHATLQPWEDDTKLPEAAPPRGGVKVDVAIVGAIGVDKGYDVLLACARNAARRGLKLQFTVVGHTIDDRRLLDTGHVFVTGQFSEADGAHLLHAGAPDIGFVPSVWPETWCYGLTTLWQARLRVAAFDLGAPAERMRARGAAAGTLLRLGMPADAVNDTLLSLGGRARRPAQHADAAHG